MGGEKEGKSGVKRSRIVDRCNSATNTGRASDWPCRRCPRPLITHLFPRDLPTTAPRTVLPRPVLVALFVKVVLFYLREIVCVSESGSTSEAFDYFRPQGHQLGEYTNVTLSNCTCGCLFSRPTLFVTLLKTKHVHTHAAPSEGKSS